MRKKILILLLLAGLSSHAQFRDSPPQNLPLFDETFWQWGYYFGTTHFDYYLAFKTKENYIRVAPEPGFHVGLISDFRITRMLSIRLEPGVRVSSRTLYFSSSFTGLTKNDTVRKINANYLVLPVMLKFNAHRNGNFRPYVMLGGTYAYNLTSYENSINDNASGRFRTRTNVYFLEVGVGFEMYMYYFKFTPSIRGVFALNNEFVPDEDPNSPWTGNLEYMGTRGIYIVLTFE